MKKLIKKYENKLLLVQSDILDGKCPNIEMQFYKNGEQSVLLEIINDLKNMGPACDCADTDFDKPTYLTCQCQITRETPFVNGYPVCSVCHRPIYQISMNDGLRQ